MLNLTDENFHAERVKPGYLLVDFFGVWCPPCKAMNPILEQVEQQFPSVVFSKLNATENPEITSEFQVQALPSFLLFKDGELADRWTGMTNAKSFAERLVAKGVAQG